MYEDSQFLSISLNKAPKIGVLQSLLLRSSFSQSTGPASPATVREGKGEGPRRAGKYDLGGKDSYYSQSMKHTL